MKLKFANGSECSYNRPFLVVKVTNEKVCLLNISTIKGKEHKLILNSNKKIIKYKPPFIMPSFIKLDEIYIVPNDPILKLKVVDKGNLLDEDEFRDIYNVASEFSKGNVVKKVVLSLEEVISLNA